MFACSFCVFFFLFRLQGGVGSVDNPEDVYDLANLVSCFFLTYCVFSFPTSWFIERYGLKAGVLAGAWLQVLGCLVRVAATPSISQPTDGSNMDEHMHGSLWLLLAGQVIASLGQAFFVNPPPLLAAIWFGVNERTLATTIACNANTLGIAAAYMLGPFMVDRVADLPAYMFVCFVASLTTALMASFYFPSAPPTPPSHSQVEPEAFPPVASPSPQAIVAEIDITSPNGSVAIIDIAVAPDSSTSASSSTSSTSSSSSSSPPAAAATPDATTLTLPLPRAVSAGSEEGSASESEDEGDQGLSSSSSSSLLADHDCGHSHSHSHSHSAHSHARANGNSKGYGSNDKTGRCSGSSASAPVPAVAASSSCSSSAAAGCPSPVSSASHKLRPHHLRVRSQGELALAANYSRMASPPCAFVRKEALAAERARSKNASRILASARMFRRMFQAPGFAHTLMVFGVAEAAINGFAAFMYMIVEPWSASATDLTQRQRMHTNKKNKMH